MPKLRKNASKEARQKRMREEMHKFKEGTLHSGSAQGPIVKSRAQAIAIALSESGQSNKNRKAKRKK